MRNITIRFILQHATQAKITSDQILQTRKLQFSAYYSVTKNTFQTTHTVTRDVSCCTVLMKTEKGYEISEVFRETVSKMHVNITVSIYGLINKLAQQS